MDYLTVKEFGDRWDITPRCVQNMCKDGRIAEAVRFGRAWMIPKNAKRPADMRCRGKALKRLSLKSSELCYSIPVVSYTVPGTASETVKLLSDNPNAANLAKAQFAYLRGDIDTSEKLSKELMYNSDDFEIKAGAMFLCNVCAMYQGNVSEWLVTRELLQNLPCKDDSQRARREMWLAVLGASIYDMSYYPEWFINGCFDSLPLGYYPGARVHYIKYIYLRGDAVVKNQPFEEKEFNNWLFLLPAICEPLISQTAAEKAIVSEIYLRLFCASSYHHAGEDAFAAKHIERALELALPDKLYAPFVEQRLNLDSLIDDKLKELDIEMLGNYKALHKMMISGWKIIHNTVMDKCFSNELTAKELEAARLAAFGLANKEIAERMCVKINSVKSYLRTAMDKTGAKKRAELSKYV